jgi:hypothetical protein
VCRQNARIKRREFFLVVRGIVMVYQKFCKDIGRSLTHGVHSTSVVSSNKLRNIKNIVWLLKKSFYRSKFFDL